jgi:nucleoside 2-deoxyribosyltransferase
MRRPLRLYVAGPLGFSEAGREFYDKTLVRLITSRGYQVLDPWKLTEQHRIDRVRRMRYGPKKRDAWRALNPKIAENNRRAIDRSDGLVAVLDGVDVDSGTAAEIGYAFAKGKRIVGYRGDFRLSADNEGSMVNIQVEYFIRASGGTITSNSNDLADVLRQVFPRR